MAEKLMRGVLAAAALAGCAAALHAQGPRTGRDTGTGLIVGQVVDGASGKPIGGAIVAIRGAGAAPRILTRPDGRYLFRDLPPGSFTITAIKSGYAEGAVGRRRPGGPAQSLFLTADQRVGDALIRLWKLGAIAGTVVDESGEPVVRVQVRAWQRSFVAGQRALVGAGTTLTDDRGSYRFGSLIPAEYLIAASARHIARLAAGAPEGSGGQALQVGDFLYALANGVVTPPPPHERLSIYPTLFYPSERDVAHAAVLTVASGEERAGVDVHVQPVPTARVSGILAASGGAVGRMTVRLVPEGRAGIAIDPDAPSTISDDSGAFVLSAVPAGSYTIRATSTIRPGAIQQAEVGWAAVPLEVGGADIDGLIVQLMPGMHISGSVEFDGTSNPPSAAQLRRIPLLIESATSDGEAGAVPRISVDERGEFSTPGLAAVAYVLRVTDSPPGWMFHSASYNGHDISTTPIELTSSDAAGVAIRFTDRWSSIQGTVQSASRNPDADALVIMFPVDRRLWTQYGTGTRSVRAVRTTVHGSYNLGSVVPGDYLVIAIPDDKAGGWQDPDFLAAVSSSATRVTVGDGEHKTQDLRTRTLR